MNPDETLRIYSVPKESLLEYTQDHRQKFDYDSLPDDSFRVKAEEFACVNDEVEEEKITDASLDLDLQIAQIRES